ncbi:TetR family transcriptional regulator [Naasia aerilata]|uniref:TetR family transcriptional regulator n=1 Tax=Naasia aerilata TaxID=1162966 RepID=A0ABN6XNK3_9MICO|nr:TetR family transcriptional regulator [Naasia aerilata]BDZ46559.1 TetR family transcriptional regulator [Naasia aerilata]
MNASRIPSTLGTGGATPTGRPRRSSRETLQDAATELFLEQGYEQTTVDDIARRAGVARATFFNYFPAKGDLLWADLDPVLESLPSALAAQPTGESPAIGVRTALVSLTGQVPVAPVLLVERLTIGAAAEAAHAGLPRMHGVDVALRRFTLSRTHARDGIPEAFAAGATGVLLAVGRRWLAAGSDRGSLGAAVDAGLAPLTDAFAPLLPPA